MKTIRSAQHGIALAALFLGTQLTPVTPAMAQKPGQAPSYPDHVVRIVSVTSPGTGVDDYTRLLAKHLGEKLGQSFVVENRPGANTIIASEHVAKSAPDGYTLLLAAASSMSANPVLFKNLPYNPSTDFAPIARMSALPTALVVPASSPYRNVAELVAAARANPGKLNYGSSSTGYRVLLAALKDSAKIDAIDIPYKAMSSLLPDLIGGTLDYSVIEVPAIVPLVQSGRLRALAILSDQRLPVLEDVPTLAQAGVPGVSLMSWTALLAPAGTPAPIIDTLERLTLEFTTSPEAMAHYASRGSVAYPAPGPELSKTIVDDQKQWRRLIDLAGIQPE